MFDLQAMRQVVEQLNYAPLFVTVSGAHLYGFPSPDSDVDLRGCHRLPLSEVVGLALPNQTLEHEAVHQGTEIELVSHEIGKYLRLLVKSNGYILEQIFSPIIVMGHEFLEHLRPLAKCCITRHHYHHYRGFLATQRKLLDKQEPKRLKSLLYAYRVVLTGIELLQTGEVEANLPKLAAMHGLSFLDDLITQKQAELAAAKDLDWAFHEKRLQDLESELELAFLDSKLSEESNRKAVNDFLVGVRLG